MASDGIIRKSGRKLFLGRCRTNKQAFANLLQSLVLAISHVSFSLILACKIRKILFVKYIYYYSDASCRSGRGGLRAAGEAVRVRIVFFRNLCLEIFRNPSSGSQMTLEIVYFLRFRLPDRLFSLSWIFESYLKHIQARNFCKNISVPPNSTRVCSSTHRPSTSNRPWRAGSPTRSIGRMRWGIINNF